MQIIYGYKCYAEKRSYFFKEAWISNERRNALSEKEQTQFPPLCPDFVLELVSVNDDLKAAKSKM